MRCESCKKNNFAESSLAGKVLWYRDYFIMELTSFSKSPMPMPPSLIFVITGVPDSSETLQNNMKVHENSFSRMLNINNTENTIKSFEYQKLSRQSKISKCARHETEMEINESNARDLFSSIVRGLNDISPNK